MSSTTQFSRREEAPVFKPAFGVAADAAAAPSPAAPAPAPTRSEGLSNHAEGRLSSFVARKVNEVGEEQQKAVALMARAVRRRAPESPKAADTPGAPAAAPEIAEGEDKLVVSPPKARRRSVYRHPRVADIVLRALEADRVKFTAGALFCPCYLCMNPMRRNLVHKIMSHPAYVFINITCIIWVVIAADVLYAFLPASFDLWFEAIFVLAFFVVTSDLVMISTLDRRVIFSFFWWLDVVASISLLFELREMAYLLTGSRFLEWEGGEGGDANLANFNRAIRGATDVGRFVRIFRLFKMSRKVRVPEWFERFAEGAPNEAGRPGEAFILDPEEQDGAYDILQAMPNANLSQLKQIQEKSGRVLPGDKSGEIDEDGGALSTPTKPAAEGRKTGVAADGTTAGKGPSTAASTAAAAGPVGGAATAGASAPAAAAATAARGIPVVSTTSTTGLMLGARRTSNPTLVVRVEGATGSAGRAVPDAEDSPVHKLGSKLEFSFLDHKDGKGAVGLGTARAEPVTTAGGDLARPSELEEDVVVLGSNADLMLGLAKRYSAHDMKGLVENPSSSRRTAGASGSGNGIAVGGTPATASHGARTEALSSSSSSSSSATASGSAPVPGSPLERTEALGGSTPVPSRRASFSSRVEDSISTTILATEGGVGNGSGGTSVGTSALDAALRPTSGESERLVLGGARTGTVGSRPVVVVAVAAPSGTASSSSSSSSADSRFRAAGAARPEFDRVTEADVEDEVSKSTAGTNPAGAAALAPTTAPSPTSDHPSRSPSALKSALRVGGASAGGGADSPFLAARHSITGVAARSASVATPVPTGTSAPGAATPATGFGAGATKFGSGFGSPTGMFSTTRAPPPGVFSAPESIGAGGAGAGAGSGGGGAGGGGGGSAGAGGSPTTGILRRQSFGANGVGIRVTTGGAGGGAGGGSSTLGSPGDTETGFLSSPDSSHPPISKRYVPQEGANDGPEGAEGGASLPRRMSNGVLPRRRSAGTMHASAASGSSLVVVGSGSAAASSAIGTGSGAGGEAGGSGLGELGPESHKASFQNMIRGLGKKRLAERREKEQEESDEVDQVGGEGHRSEVGKRISGLIRLKVMLGVMVMLLVLPLLDYTPDTFEHLRVIESVGVVESHTKNDTSALVSLVTTTMNNYPTLLFFEVGGVVYVNNVERMEVLRHRDFLSIASKVGRAVATWDISYDNTWESIWAFIRTNVIIILLGIQAALLNRDVNQLLVRPIERLGEHLKPLLGDAIRFLSSAGNQWNINIGKKDGEELSTKLMVAAIEALRSKMDKSEKKKFGRKAILNGLRRRSIKAGGDMKSAMENLRRSSAKDLFAGSQGPDGSQFRTVSRAGEESEFDAPASGRGLRPGLSFRNRRASV